MKQEIKDRWTTALRSGEYEQGIHDFEREGRFCALGVLCDVMGQPTTLVNENGGTEGNWTFAGSVIRNEELKWAIIDRNDGSLSEDGETPWAFTDLADWIDKHVPAE